MTDEKKYEEVGHNFRFLLGWRHASVAGNLAVLYGVAALFVAVWKESPRAAWMVPLAASPIGALLWWIDQRNVDLIRAAEVVGKRLEGSSGGLYTTLVDNLAVAKRKSAYARLTITGATNIVFLGSSLGLLLLAVASLVLR